MGKAKNIPKDKDKLLLDFQEKWVLDDSRCKLAEKSRQIGWTWSTAYRLVRTHALAEHKQDSWVSSRDALQAQLFIEDCKKFAQVLQVACHGSVGSVLDADKKTSAFILRFANGTKIYSLSSNADAQAGKRGTRVLDELALHKDPKKLWDIAYPGITWGGSIECISTHRGSQNYFNKLVQEAREGGNPKGISLHRVTLADALEQGFLFKLQQKLGKDDPRQEMDEAAYYDFIRSGCSSDEAFMQEYMCQPSDDESAFISYDLIDGCTYAHGEKWEEELDAAKEYYLGVDVGRKKDLTCLYLLEKVGKHLKTRRVITMQNTKFVDQMAAIGRYAALPHVRRVCIDATGIGAMLAEEVQRLYGRKVEAVVFTNASKEDMALQLHRVMEDMLLKIPNEEKLLADIRSIRKTTTSAGNVRYEGERDENGHADRFWALALALHAAGKPKQFNFLPVPA